MSLRSSSKDLLLSLYCLVTGRGGDFLRHKQQLHRRRAQVEREMLDEVETRGGLLVENRCPACGHRDQSSTSFVNPVGFRFSVCPNDRTVYMDPVPSEETLGRLYNDPAMSFHWLKDHRPEDVRVKPGGEQDYQALLRMLGHPPHGWRLLDVGCATGAFLLTARQSFDVAGVELNEATASIARAKGLKVITGRLADVPDAGSYDVVTMLQLIEHITHPDVLLREAARVLKHGGYLYLDTPNVDSASFALFGPDHTHVSSFAHVSLLNRESLRLLADRCGLEMVAHEYCGGRDIGLHDVLTYRWTRRRFRHRMALYKPRLYYACDIVDRLTFGVLTRLLSRAGHESYQRALFRRR